MYLIRFIPNFAVFFVFLWISQIYRNFAAPRPREISEALISRSRSRSQIHIGIPACVMSSEYFMRTSLYFVRLKRITSKTSVQGNWGGRNSITTSGVNSWLIKQAGMQRWIWNLQLPMVQLSNNKFINGILGVRLTWLDCNRPRGNFFDLLSNRYWLSTNVFGKMYGYQSGGYVDMIGAEKKGV